MASESRGAGGAFFAGVIMIVVGIFGALEGLAAIIKDSFFVATPNYWISVDASSWGWIHLILGILVALAGFGVLSGQTWARVIGIILASLSAFANFMFMPFYPLWALLIIAVDLWVIWALSVWHPEEVS